MDIKPWTGPSLSGQACKPSKHIQWQKSNHLPTPSTVTILFRLHKQMHTLVSLSCWLCFKATLLLEKGEGGGGGG